MRHADVYCEPQLHNGLSPSRAVGRELLVYNWQFWVLGTRWRTADAKEYHPKYTDAHE